MAYVYRHIRLDKNEPFYIGIGSDENYNRAYVTKQRNKLWNNIVSKSNYEIEILLDNLTWEQACEKEKEFIALYGRKDLNKGILANLTNGGEGTLGIIIDEEGRKARSEKLKNIKRNPISEELRYKRHLLGLGKIFTNEHRKNISNALKGKNKNPLSETTKEKLRIANIGKIQSIETIQKRVDKIKGQKRSEETKEKMRLARILYYKNKNQQL